MQWDVYAKSNATLVFLMGVKNLSNIVKNLSAFVLVDYYKRNFKYSKDDNITDLLYSPVNAENRIFFRLSNKVKSNQKIFLKIGYFDGKLFYRNYSLSGWKGYIGFEIKG